jgi:serine protease Do
MKKNNGLIIIIVCVVMFFITLIAGLGITIYNGIQDGTNMSSIFSQSTETDEVREDKELNDNSNYVTDVYNMNNEAVISVVNLKKISVPDFVNGQMTTQQVEQGSGSGFVYKKENGYYYAITNYHVVEDTDQVQVVLAAEDGGEPEVVDAEIVGGSKQDDIVVLKFKSDRDITPVTIGDSDALVPGEAVVAMGSPYGTDFQGTVTTGVVSSTSRTMSNGDGTTSDFIQTDAAINSGNSGGPLFNADGEVIGINSRKIADGTTDNIAFAIPINHAMEVVEKIEALEE